MDVRFVILSATGKHRTTTKSLPLLVGRSEEAKLRIAQDCVSRRHCQFLAKDDEVFVRDLGSTNGTILDGERIEPETDTFVRPGGVVKVGGATFRVDYGTADTTAVVPSAAEEPAEAAAEKVTVPMTDDPPHIDDAAQSDEIAWPQSAEAAQPPSEGDLGDFFKSLS
ncbi:MAG: FHA domain-containing protein [Planctomycetia bacterium]|nr:FHA domain-containing protein [Planctomycetia bacterium]